MKIEFYLKNISTIVIFEKKKFEANWAGGWVMAYTKSVKASPQPSAQFNLIVVLSYHVTPLFHASFSQRFHFCHYFFSKILLSICSHILNAVWALTGQHDRIELVTRPIYQGSLCHILLEEDNPNTTKVDFGYCEDTYHTCQKAVFLNPYRGYQAFSHYTSKCRFFLGLGADFIIYQM